MDADVDYSNIEAKSQVYYDDSLDNVVVVDGIPVIDNSKLDRLLAEICEEFGHKGVKIQPDDINMPWNETTGKSQGFLYIKFKTADDATNAIASVHGLAFDAKHTFKLNRFTDIEYNGNMDKMQASRIFHPSMYAKLSRTEARAGTAAASGTPAADPTFDERPAACARVQVPSPSVATSQRLTLDALANELIALIGSLSPEVGLTLLQLNHRVRVILLDNRAFWQHLAEQNIPALVHGLELSPSDIQIIFRRISTGPRPNQHEFADLDCTMIYGVKRETFLDGIPNAAMPLPDGRHLMYWTHTEAGLFDMSVQSFIKRFELDGDNFANNAIVVDPSPTKGDQPFLVACAKGETRLMRLERQRDTVDGKESIRLRRRFVDPTAWATLKTSELLQLRDIWVLAYSLGDPTVVLVAWGHKKDGSDKVILHVHVQQPFVAHLVENCLVIISPGPAGTHRVSVYERRAFPQESGNLPLSDVNPLTQWLVEAAFRYDDQTKSFCFENVLDADCFRLILIEPQEDAGKTEVSVFDVPWRQGIRAINTRAVYTVPFNGNVCAAMFCGSVLLSDPETRDTWFCQARGTPVVLSELWSGAGDGLTTGICPYTGILTMTGLHGDSGQYTPLLEEDSPSGIPWM